MKPLSIQPTAIGECWDCQACGDCCRGAIIFLDDADLERLRAQEWEQHPDFKGVKILERTGLFQKKYQLAHRKDGFCVFMLEDGRCRIHAEYGEPEKPLICRLAPYQIVPAGDRSLITLRRYCPAAAQDIGRPIEDRISEIKKLVQQQGKGEAKEKPPQIAPGLPTTWHYFLRTSETIERLLLDQNVPMVRRMAHGLAMVELLARCKTIDFDDSRFGELIDLLENSVIQESAPLFANRRPPGRAAHMLFRQILLEYLRLHPRFVITQSFRERIRLIRTAMVFAKGRGRIPKIHPAFPEISFEKLEEPIGTLQPEVLQPITRWFEAAAASKHYALLGKDGWSLLDCYRSLAICFPIALWLLRFSAGDNEPTVDEAVDVVRALDRGQGFAPLCGRRHRRRLASIARLGEIGRLIAWYAR